MTKQRRSIMKKLLLFLLLTLLSFEETDLLSVSWVIPAVLLLFVRHGISFLCISCLPFAFRVFRYVLRLRVSVYSRYVCRGITRWGGSSEALVVHYYAFFALLPPHACQSGIITVIQTTVEDNKEGTNINHKTLFNSFYIEAVEMYFVTCQGEKRNWGWKKGITSHEDSKEGNRMLFCCPSRIRYLFPFICNWMIYLSEWHTEILTHKGTFTTGDWQAKCTEYILHVVLTTGWPQAVFSKAKQRTAIKISQQETRLL